MSASRSSPHPPSKGAVELQHRTLGESDVSAGQGRGERSSPHSTAPPQGKCGGVGGSIRPPHTAPHSAVPTHKTGMVATTTGWRAICGCGWAAECRSWIEVQELVKGHGRLR